MHWSLMREKISRKTNLGGLVRDYPEAAYILFAQGMQCIGCGLAAHETLEQGLASHGYNDADIGTIIDGMNRAVEENERRMEKTPKIAPIMPEHLKVPAKIMETKKPAKKKKSKTG